MTWLDRLLDRSHFAKIVMSFVIAAVSYYGILLLLLLGN